MPLKQDDILRDLPTRAGRAVAQYWATRTAQRDRQKQTGKADQGLRSAVTGGAQKTPFRKTGAAGVSESALLSEVVLAKDWNRPEEDEAWSHR